MFQHIVFHIEVPQLYRPSIRSALANVARPDKHYTLGVCVSAVTSVTPLALLVRGSFSRLHTLLSLFLLVRVSMQGFW